MTESLTRRTFLISSCATAASLGSLNSTQAAFNSNYYGAIAYSPSTGAWGRNVGSTDQDTAESQAIDTCRKYGGKADTEIVVALKNAWFAFAKADGGAYAGGWGIDPTTAMEVALDRCGRRTGKHVLLCDYTSPYTTIEYDASDVPDNEFNERGIVKEAVKVVGSRFRNIVIAQNVYSVLRGGAFVTRAALDAMGYDTSDERANNLLWNQLTNLRKGERDGEPYFPRVVFRTEHAESKYWAHVKGEHLSSVSARSPDAIRGEFVMTLNRYHLGASGHGRDPVAWAAVIAHEMLHCLGHRHEADKYDDEHQINVFQRAIYHDGKYRKGLACPRFY